MNTITLTKLCKLLNGTLFIEGKEVKQKTDIDKASKVVIRGISPIDSITKGIVYVQKIKYLKRAIQSKALALLIAKDITVPKDKPTIKCANGKIAFIKLLSIFKKHKNIKRLIDSKTSIGQNVHIGQNVAIMPYAVIDDNVFIDNDAIIYPHCYIASSARIGKNSILYSGVSVYEDCVIGNNVIIKSNTTIGSDGFSYHYSNNKHHKIEHLGIVKIEDNVEIGASVTIDRATLGQTLICKGSKIDNQVHIAHGCTVGENSIIAGQAGLAGSVSLGANVVIAGQAGIADHVDIGDDSIVMAKSMVHHSLRKKSKVFGYPARPINEAKKIYKAILRLPSLLKKKI